MSGLFAPGGGVWEEIGKATASNDASIDFTWTKTYKATQLIVNGANPIGDIELAQIRTSADGSAWDVGVNDYKYAFHRSEMDAAPSLSEVGDSADSAIGLFDEVGFLDNEHYSGVITLLSPAETSYTLLTHLGVALDLFTVPEFVVGAGVRVSAAPVKGIRFMFSGSNIDVGDFACYGLL